MSTTMQETHYELPARGLFALDDAAQHVVACISGELWLTVTGDPRDIVLQPGDRWSIEGGCAVISALRPSSLTVVHPQACAAPCTPRRSGAAWTLAALRRWRHPPLAELSAAQLR